MIKTFDKAEKNDEKRNLMNMGGLLMLLVMMQCAPRYAMAASPACKGLGAEIIFKDSIYGMLLGGIGTGLYILASEKNEKAGQQIAAGGLIGLGAGAVVGLVESSMRDCDEQAQLEKSKSGWQRPIFSAERRRMLSYEQPSKATVDVGIQIGYRYY